MADLSLEQRIAFAAIQYDRARCDAERIRAERAAVHCERSECEYEARSKDQWKPCWKNYQDDGCGDQYLADQSEWCPSCRLRQRIHDAHHQAMVKRGARLRELHRLCELSGGWQVAPTIKLLSVVDGTGAISPGFRLK